MVWFGKKRARKRAFENFNREAHHLYKNGSNVEVLKSACEFNQAPDDIQEKYLRQIHEAAAANEIDEVLRLGKELYEWELF